MSVHAHILPYTARSLLRFEGAKDLFPLGLGGIGKTAGCVERRSLF